MYLYLLSRFRSFENQLLNHVNDLVKYCKDHCIKNIIIGGKVSDPGRLGYLTCNRIQIYPPPSAIQDTMVAISASSRTATCRFIATVKALTKMKDEEEMKRGVHITGTITMEATHHHPTCLHVLTTLVNEKITGFDCPILDISDSKMGKVGLAILVDMSPLMAPARECDGYLKLTRKNLKRWKQPSIYAWPIVNRNIFQQTHSQRNSLQTDRRQFNHFSYRPTSLLISFIRVALCICGMGYGLP